MPENLAITQIKGRLLGITQLRLSPLVGESITNIVVKAIYFFQKRYPNRIFFSALISTKILSTKQHVNIQRHTVYLILIHQLVTCNSKPGVT